jgi:hypothetical protein
MGLALLIAKPFKGIIPLTKFFQDALTVIPWVIYSGLLVSFLFVRRWKAYFVCCTVLACVLLMNIIGCREMWIGFSNVN